VFLSPDRTRLQDLAEAVRKLLAWKSILAEAEVLDLGPQQVKQAEAQRAVANATVNARPPGDLPVAPGTGTADPASRVTWQALRLSGQEALAPRASRKLRADELLLTAFAPSRLRMELDCIPLWRGDHVPLAQIADDFARYLYLPRLKGNRCSRAL
jgi:hypothetical protein